MKKTLRPYQQEALDKLRARLREFKEPVVCDLSVGAGKSLIIAELALILEKANWRALCLTMNSTLIGQNAQTYRDQGGNPGIYCTGLKEKNSTANIIFASPHSISIGIRKGRKIKDVPFNLIIVDECHNVDHHHNASMYMRILNHYGYLSQLNDYTFRVVGLTGTPFRGKNESIVGKSQYFKETVIRISTAWLISQGYRLQPGFGKPHVEGFDMSALRVDRMGKFKHDELQAVVSQDERLTGEIIREVVEIVEGGRNGAFIFASTIQHAHECMKSLPVEYSACVTGDTPHDVRKVILQRAKDGEIKYLVSVSTLYVGVDVPNFDVCAWLRPTESLTIFTQGIGRVLRLHPDKQDAIVLDYAGNLERHGDIDDPIINEAIAPKEGDQDYCIPCYRCNALNKVMARRCVGVDESSKKRCDYFFQFKPCGNCGTENDITARHCRYCEDELIDPNKKLRLLDDDNMKTLDVIQAKYWVKHQIQKNAPIVNVVYQTTEQNIIESYFVNSEKSKNVFYGRFVKPHIENSKEYYPHLTKFGWVKDMIEKEPIRTPSQLVCRRDEYGRYSIMKKIFGNELPE